MDIRGGPSIEGRMEKGPGDRMPPELEGLKGLLIGFSGADGVRARESLNELTLGRRGLPGDGD